MVRPAEPISHNFLSPSAVEWHHSVGDGLRPAKAPQAPRSVP